MKLIKTYSSGVFMPKPIKRVVVTGGAGNIAYSLLFKIASGELFGPEQPVALHILEIEPMLNVLEGVRMELEDLASPLLSEIRVGSDPYKIFEDVDYALLVGSKPRGPGMERKDLLTENGKIFVEQGKALNAVAKREVKVMVVGNPCNTNCLIALSHAPNLSPKNFHALTRLDQNRATALLAVRAEVPVAEVSNVTIWGNHSATQVPDFYHAKVKGRPALDVIKDVNWLEDTFVDSVQKRGAAIIAARGKSSAASAAHAVVDAVKSLEQKTQGSDWFSTGVYTAGNCYGIDPNLIFSLPCRSMGKGDYVTVNDLEWNEFLRAKIKFSEKELLEERDLVKDQIKR